MKTLTLKMTKPQNRVVLNKAIFGTISDWSYLAVRGMRSETLLVTKRGAALYNLSTLPKPALSVDYGLFEELDFNAGV